MVIVVPSASETSDLSGGSFAIRDRRNCLKPSLGE
jgi:hypothetical protein